MGVGASNPTASMSGIPDDYWKKWEFQKANKTCWMCNKPQGQIIDGKYCSIECKEHRPEKMYPAGPE